MAEIPKEVREHYSRIGKKSAEKRLGGLTPEQRSERMRQLRKGRKNVKRG